MCWKFSIPNIYIIFSWKKIFIKSPYHKRKKDKKTNTHPLSPTTPSHTTTKLIPWIFKKKFTFLLWETTKLFLPISPKKQTFGLVPIPKKIHLSQSLKKKPPLNLPHPPLLTQKKPFWKKRIKTPNPSSHFFKTPLTSCNSFNLIELSTPYTHWNPII